MRTIRTTLLLSLPCGACVLNQPESTTDIALDTGSETTQVSADDSSSSSAADDSSSSSSADASSSSGAVDSASDDSSSGAPDLCGNGILDPGEDCDGEAGKKSCVDQGPDFNGGELGCTADCHYDTGPCERCEAPTLEPCDADNSDPFNAIELDCDLNRGWTPKNSVPLSKRNILDNVDPTSFRVWNTYGNSKPWTPRAGERALIISTSSLAPVDNKGALNMGPGHMNPGADNTNPTFNGGVPIDYLISAQPGGTAPFEHCDGMGDCSNTTQDQWEFDQKVVDFFYLDFQTVVPAGTHGYELDVAFFTAHYPVYQNEPKYNDVALVWSQSELYVGSITYFRDKQQNLAPMSLPALADADLIVYDGGTSTEMLGTGFHGKDTPGGATPWLTAAGPALPGESLTLAMVVFDANDSYLDSAMLVDNFRWSCAGCELGVDCGLRLQQ